MEKETLKVLEWDELDITNPPMAPPNRTLASFVFWRRETRESMLRTKLYKEKLERYGKLITRKEQSHETAGTERH